MLHTFSYAGEVVVVSFYNLLSSSFPLVRMMLQHNCFICWKTTRCHQLTRSTAITKSFICPEVGETLTGCFNLSLCGLVPQVWEAEDGVVILILKNNSQDKDPQSQLLKLNKPLKCFYIHNTPRTFLYLKNSLCYIFTNIIKLTTITTINPWCDLIPSNLWGRACAASGTPPAETPHRPTPQMTPPLRPAPGKKLT